MRMSQSRNDGCGAARARAAYPTSAPSSPRRTAMPTAIFPSVCPQTPSMSQV